MSKSMQDVWEYIGKVMKEPNVYCGGKWGQFIGGKQAFDCVCIIKACGWEVPVGVDITKNQYSYIGNHKDDMPDVWIGEFYNHAAQKDTKLDTLPSNKYSFVYQYEKGKEFAHIGIYNPVTKTVREMVAGSVMKAREIALSSVNYYHRWSNGSYFNDSAVPVTQPVSPPAQTALKAGTKCDLKNTMVYQSSVATTGTPRSGTYWTWDDKVLNGRIKMTNKAERVGVAGQISFWCNVSDLGLAASPVASNVQKEEPKPAPKKELTATSFPDYIKGEKYEVYRVRTKWGSGGTSIGEYRIWGNAFRAWTKYKDQGYHVYDNAGKQLD